MNTRYSNPDRLSEELRALGYKILEDLYPSPKKTFIFDKLCELYEKKSSDKSDSRIPFVFSFFDFYAQARREGFLSSSSAPAQIAQTESRKQKVLSRYQDKTSSNVILPQGATIPSEFSIRHALDLLKSKLDELKQKLSDLKDKLLLLSDTVQNKQRGGELIKQKLTENNILHPEILSELPGLTIALYKELLAYLQSPSVQLNLNKDSYRQLLAMVIANKHISLAEKEHCFRETPQVNSLNNQEINELLNNCLTERGVVRLISIIAFFNQPFLRSALSPLSEQNKNKIAEILFTASPPLSFSTEETDVLLGFIKNFNITLKEKDLNLDSEYEASHLFLAFALIDASELNRHSYEDVFERYLKGNEKVTFETIKTFIKIFLEKTIPDQDRLRLKNKYILAFCKNIFVTFQEKVDAIKQFFSGKETFYFLESYLETPELCFAQLSDISLMLTNLQPSIKKGLKFSFISNRIKKFLDSLKKYLSETAHNFSLKEYTVFLAAIEVFFSENPYKKMVYESAKKEFLEAIGNNPHFSDEMKLSLGALSPTT